MSLGDGRRPIPPESAVPPSREDALRCDAEGHCITCSDEAIPMRVVEILADGDVALCEALPEDGVGETGRIGGPGGPDGPDARAEVLIGLLDGVVPGEVVLVHAGAALARVTEESRRHARR